MSEGTDGSRSGTYHSAYAPVPSSATYASTVIGLPRSRHSDASILSPGAPRGAIAFASHQRPTLADAATLLEQRARTRSRTIVVDISPPADEVCTFATTVLSLP